MSHEKIRTKKKDKAKETYKKYGKYNNKSIRINQQNITKSDYSQYDLKKNIPENLLKSSNNISRLFDIYQNFI